MMTLKGNFPGHRLCPFPTSVLYVHAYALIHETATLQDIVCYTLQHKYPIDIHKPSHMKNSLILLDVISVNSPNTEIFDSHTKVMIHEKSTLSGIIRDILQYKNPVFVLESLHIKGAYFRDIAIHTLQFTLYSNITTSKHTSGFGWHHEKSVWNRKQHFAWHHETHWHAICAEKYTEKYTWMELTVPINAHGELYCMLMHTEHFCPWKRLM